jgi:mannosyltransferase OCH1-like enzyme
MLKYIIIFIIIYIVFYYINSINYDKILPNNHVFNIYNNYYDLKKSVYLILNNNDLLNHKSVIPKYLKERNDISLLNKYELIKNNDDFSDYHFVIYYLNNNNCKIIIRRLDKYSIENNFFIKIYDIYNNDNEIINILPNNMNVIIKYYKSNVKLFKVKYIKNKIPKVIIQTGESNETNLAKYNASMTLIELNPEYRYIYFDKNDRIIFLKKYFKNNVLDAYNKIIPGSFKADLFRYCYLYINGGCYFDDKIINRIPIRDFLNKDDKIFLCKDIDFLYYKGCYNAIIFSAPKNNIMKDCIIQCVNNIKNNYYGINCLDITGPSLLYKVVSKYNEKYKCKFFNYFILNFRHFAYISMNGKKIFNTCYYNYYTKYIDTNYYIYKWFFKKIYN